ncbi:MAG: HEAT repeat domain-containing protein [Candidatus Wukongarchaeota archaeon]|nr:HEAT repeat domain-containing protein [Candidatus Wukongarchaeota archaeon]
MKTKNDVEGLIKVLKYKKDFKVRAEAAWVLGKIGDNRVVKPLKQTLNDEDWDVRKAVREALERVEKKRKPENNGRSR